MEFREKLESIRQRWDALEIQYCPFTHGTEAIPEFHKWFTNEKSHIIAKCMLKNVRV